MNAGADRPILEHEEPPNKNVVSSKTLEVEAAFPHIQPLLRSLSVLDSKVIWAQRRSDPRVDDFGVLIVRFGRQIESQFGLTREVAIVVLPYDDLRYRDFQDIPTILKNLPREVTQRVVLVSSRDNREGLKLDDWSTHDRLVVGVGSVGGDPRPAARQLVATLRTRVYARNPYSATAPVHDDAFFGRRIIVQELFDSVMSQRPIALVGCGKLVRHRC